MKSKTKKIDLAKKAHALVVNRFFPVDHPGKEEVICYKIPFLPLFLCDWTKIFSPESGIKFANSIFISFGSKRGLALAVGGDTNKMSPQKTYSAIACIKDIQQAYSHLVFSQNEIFFATHR
jgi:hypothetical protein